MEKLWTTAEAAQYLGVSEEEVERLVRSGRLAGHRLGGQFLRFNPDDVKTLKLLQAETAPKVPPTSVGVGGVATVPPTPWQERVGDFLYFNDLYLISAGLLVGLVMYLLIAS